MVFRYNIPSDSFTVHTDINRTETMKSVSRQKSLKPLTSLNKDFLQSLGFKLVQAKKGDSSKDEF